MGKNKQKHKIIQKQSNVENIADNSLFVKNTKWIMTIILLISLFLRTWNLRNTPCWYGDEFIYFTGAWELINGSLRIGALKWSFFSYFLPNPPLWYIITGLLLKIFTYDILIARLWTAILGVIATLFIYFTGKELISKRAGIWASFIFAIYPLAVIHNRWSFIHNQAMLLIFTCFYFCIKFYNTRRNHWLNLAILSAGLASITCYWIIGIFLFLYVFVFITDRKKIVKTIALSIVPIVLLLIAMFIKDGDRLFYEIKRIISETNRGTAQKTIFDTIKYIFNNYVNFFKIDYMIFLGGIGIFFIQKRFYKYVSLIFFFFLSIEIFRQRSNIPVFFYPAIGLVPILPIGVAALFDRASQIIEKLLLKANKQKILKWTTAIFSLILVLVFSPMVKESFTGVITSKLKTKIDYWANESVENTEATAKFINEKIGKDDFVIASGELRWLLKCKTTLLTQVSAKEGVPYDPDVIIEDKDFFFDCSHTNAKFFVLDNIERRWTMWQGGCMEVVYKMEKENWVPIKQIGEYIVYANPKLNPDIANTNRQYGGVSIINNPDAYAKIAEQYFNKGDFNMAAYEMEKAARLRPNDPQMYYNLGAIYYNKKEFSKVRTNWEIVLKLDPNNIQAKQGLESLKNH
ncbi:MAG: glycosyltransferase family 39 protein [Candidatus Firestonebacteria bacterium]